MVYPKIMRVYRINSRAKVNLNLNVIKKSKIKKLHLIESLVCFVNLSDKIYISKLKSNSHPSVVKRLGMACSYPGTFNSSIHAILSSTNYKAAILKTIKAGGCNCSRANFIGAYFSALKGFNCIPKSWIKKTIPAKKILDQK